MGTDFKVYRARWRMDGEGLWLSLLIDREQHRQARHFAETMEKPHAAALREWRPRRSLDANAYLWTLLGKLSERVGLPSVEIYRKLIPDVGGNSDTVCVLERAAAKLARGWEAHGLGWVCETFPSKLPGCVNATLYYGSSTYDTAQMSRLLELAVQECRQQGIETRTPRELALLMEAWDEKTDKGA